MSNAMSFERPTEGYVPAGHNVNWDAEGNLTDDYSKAAFGARMGYHDGTFTFPGCEAGPYISRIITHGDGNTCFARLDVNSISWKE